ncbi:protein semi-rolled leaf 2 isoform X1 [Tanacetum coccineum]|uniref:Protein semi-rolled leaf 2 isoform X1 n=1 Tax=Tanacetum coccineum TaxID=301880 RepID=A0ABQ4YJ30_9ASTR
MSSRSRHPIKRYKQLLADIFPRSQGGEPNERKIGKLCEYASRNPLRIPKITDYLEQKFYRSLRNNNIGAVKSVLLVYGKLLSSCKVQMPLFASSLLGIVGTLLVQTQNHEMQILGCHALVNFISNQVDSAYMFNLDGLIPKLCQLAEEVGDDERVLRIRSAGLEVLAFLMLFMGEQPHVSLDFENIISVTLENYTDTSVNQEAAMYDRQLSLAHAHVPSAPSFSHFSKASEIVNSKPQDIPPGDAHKNPSYWARACLHNMALSVKGVTAVRRVMEPIFNKFDTDKLWVSEKGLAFSVLKYLLMILEEPDDRSHLLLPILIKHLDNKDVIKQPVLQLHIVNVATELSEYVKQHASVTIVGVIADLIKHLRKCLQRSSESLSPEEGCDSCYTDLQCALENCISKLSCKVGDVGPILDTMAVVLENIPSIVAMARAILSAVYQTAQVISSIPNKTYYKKVFPDALFHHLLLAMSHPDHETRVLAHRVFSIVLVPSLSQTWSILDLIPSQAGFPTTISQGSNKSILETIDERTMEKEDHDIDNNVTHNTESLSCGSIEPSLRDKKTFPSSMRLSGHQVGLVLSSIWIQATSMDNAPTNFEAMAHTYTLALSVIFTKSLYHLESVKLKLGFPRFGECPSKSQYYYAISTPPHTPWSGLQPSQRRPLFMLASYMIIVSGTACHLPELIYMVKSTLTEETVDPYLVLDENIRLQAICTKHGYKNCYGSHQDEASATEPLGAMEMKEQQLKDIFSMHLVSSLGKSSEEELSNMNAQLSQWFMPDDEYSFGPPLFMGTTKLCSPLSHTDIQAFDEVMPHAQSADEDALDQHGSQSDDKAPLSINSADILSVNQLMESVEETAYHDENMTNSSMPVTYDEMKNQCEALMMGKQKKMSVLQSFKEKQEAMATKASGGHEKLTPLISNNQLELPEVEAKSWTSDEAQVRNRMTSLNEYGPHNSFKLPALSPYDKFLKSARRW